MTLKHRWTANNRDNLLPILIVLLIGIGLRMALHDFHGLEGDDGVSLMVARHETGDLVRGLMALELDVHPPLHFLLLKAWTGLMGSSLLSLRLMNYLADLLTGALLIRLTGRVFDRRAALIAGLLWGLSPLLIYSGYLIRMYTLLATFATAGAVCIIEGASSPRRMLWYGGAAVCGLAAAYTHVIGALILAALAFTVFIEWAAAYPRKLRDMVVNSSWFVLAGLLYLPFAGAVWNLFRSGRPLGAQISEASFQDPLSALSAIVGTLFTHRWLIDQAAIAILLAAALVMGSLLVWQRLRRQSAGLIVLTWAALAGMSGLAWIAGMYKARYLTPLVPLVMAITAGLLSIQRLRRVMPFALLLLVFTSAAGIRLDLNRDFRDDWLAAARFIAEHERPGDVIIIIPDWGREAFQYHYSGSAPVNGVFSQVSADTAIAPVLASLAAGHQRAWYINYQPEVSDPAGRARAWFRAQAVTITEGFPSGMHIRYYDLAPEQSTLPKDAIPFDARFSDTMRLHGVYLPLNQGSAEDTRLHPPSNWVQVVLYWEALLPGPDVMPRVRLTDTYGQVYGAALERENDVPHRAPVTTWQPGEVWEVSYDINLNPQTPPGTYNIEVMVLNNAGEPLLANGKDAGDYWVVAGQFVVK